MSVKAARGKKREKPKKVRPSVLADESHITNVEVQVGKDFSKLLAEGVSKMFDDEHEALKAIACGKSRPYAPCTSILNETTDNNWVTFFRRKLGSVKNFMKRNQVAFSDWKKIAKPGGTTWP